jgi:hypothetical protein
MTHSDQTCEKEKFSFKFSCKILLVQHLKMNAEYLESDTSSETMIVLEDDQKVQCDELTLSWENISYSVLSEMVIECVT